MREIVNPFWLIPVFLIFWIGPSWLAYRDEPDSWRGFLETLIVVLVVELILAAIIAFCIFCIIKAIGR